MNTWTQTDLCKEFLLLFQVLVGLLQALLVRVQVLLHLFQLLGQLSHVLKDLLQERNEYMLPYIQPLYRNLERLRRGGVGQAPCETGTIKVYFTRLRN